MSDLVIGGIYTHYKNKNYKVLGIARHSETLEDFVVYECLYETDQKLWIRPKKMFTEIVKVGDYEGPRFRLTSK